MFSSARLRSSAPAFVSVCLSVCVQDYSKWRAWIWMKCYVSTDVGTWTNWLTFEPDPDHSPDARTGLLPPISYRLRNFAALPIVWRISRAFPYQFAPNSHAVF